MFTFSPLQITLASAIKDTQQQIIDVQNQLSSGKRNLNAGENGVVTRLASQASAYDVASRNVSTASNVLTVGQTTLTSIVSIVTQLQNLATQAFSAGVTTADLTNLDATFTQLWNQIPTLITAASVNGNNILNSSLTVTYDPNATTPSTITIPSQATSLTSGANYIAMAALVAAASTPLTTAAAGSTTLQATFLGYLNASTGFLNDISTAQGSLQAYSATLDAISTGTAALSTGLNSTVSSMENIDSTAMQTKLQSLNNQQSIDYYLVSQMNTESSAILAIFR